MKTADQDKIDWIKERFNYLLAKKYQLEEYMELRQATKDLHRHREQIVELKIEMKNIDQERTVMCRKVNEHRF